MHIIDQLSAAVKAMQNPTAVGLDTRYEYLPEGYAPLGENWLEDAARGVLRFNKELIDGLCGIIPAVKVQIAYYEMYGLPGMQCFYETVKYAKERGMVVIADAKRGDIGATAQAYAHAFLSGPEIAGRRCDAFPADILTVNPYFGTDGLQPFLDACAGTGKGLFILVKTSNPTSGEFQDQEYDGKTLYERVGDQVAAWAAPLMGESGYSSIGAVVGATYPAQGAALRKRLPGIYFLVPGYGAQGAKGADLAGCFDGKGGGAIINASRSIICAHRKQPGVHFVEAARNEALRMREDIMSAVGSIR